MSRGRMRHQLFLKPEISTELARLAARPGASKSAILETALTSWIETRGQNETQVRFQARLDNMSRQLGRIERNTHILVETLSAFVRYELAIHAPLAADDDIGHALAEERFNSFVTTVARRLADGRKTFDEENR